MQRVSPHKQDVQSWNNLYQCYWHSSPIIGTRRRHVSRHVPLSSRIFPITIPSHQQHSSRTWYCVLYIITRVESNIKYQNEIHQPRCTNPPQITHFLHIRPRFAWDTLWLWCITVLIRVVISHKESFARWRWCTHWWDPLFEDNVASPYDHVTNA